MAKPYVNTCSDCDKEWRTVHRSKAMRCRSCYIKHRWTLPEYRATRPQRKKKLVPNCSKCGYVKPRAKATYVFNSTLCRSCAATKMWNKKRKPPLTCGRCGKTFPFDQSGGKPRIYCSMRCRGNRVTKRCPKCNQEFSVPLSNASRYNFCSITCAHDPAVFRDCETCGAEFRLNASEAKVRGRFCSFMCYRRFTGESSIERITREAIERVGLSAIREFSIGGKDVFDFYVPSRNLLIECDGTYWHSLPGVPQRDAAKQARARAAGYRVVRFDEKLIESKSFIVHLNHALSVTMEHPQLPLFT